VGTAPMATLPLLRISLYLFAADAKGLRPCRNDNSSQWRARPPFVAA
jgi:hypothetical protein